MKCDLVGSLNFLCKFPNSLKENRWHQAALVAFSVLAIVGVVVYRSLVGRASMTEKPDVKDRVSVPKKPIFDAIIADLKIKILDQNYSPPNCIRAFAESILKKGLGEIALNGGVLHIEPVNQRSEIKVNYHKDNKSEELTSDQVNAIRKLIFPSLEEIFTLIKEAIQTMHRDAIWRNYKFRHHYPSPQTSELALHKLRVPGGGEGRIFVVQTADGRIWQLDEQFRRSIQPRTTCSRWFRNL